MIDGMTMVRKTVTLPSETVDAIEELSGGNFSAFTAEALAKHVRRHHLRAVVGQIEAETGPFTAEEREAARRDVLGG